MAFVVLYDACVLYPNTQRDLLIRLAQTRLVQARWTDRILDEVFDNLREDRPDLDPAKLARTRGLMVSAVRECLVVGYEPLIGALSLPDPDDRHVLAAAIRSRSQLIVTNNLKDFPVDALAAWDIEPKSADDFVSDQIGLNASVVWACVQQIASSWKSWPGTVDDVLVSLERCGLVRSVAEIRVL